MNLFREQMVRDNIFLFLLDTHKDVMFIIRSLRPALVPDGAWMREWDGLIIN
jgi:hypothetical protein